MSLLAPLWEKQLDSEVLQTPFGQIRYKIEKKLKNRHTYIRIKEGFVDIKANRFTSKSTIIAWLLANAKNITSKLQIKKIGFFLAQR